MDSPGDCKADNWEAIFDDEDALLTDHATCDTQATAFESNASSTVEAATGDAYTGM